MAASSSTARKNLLKVKSYYIDQAQVLGNGAFGIVYEGSDGKKNTIAAKRIDGNTHPRILTQDLDRFLQLDHPNVMKILDVEKTDNILWLMMPFCQLGDLNHFCKTRDVLNETNLKVMKQIAAGLNYLHWKDIVHRDIKPANVLVASEIPLRLLLADFDVSKCLDPEVETSLMTSNIGTLAFKAPEFFQRTSPGKIEYHRNVDIYAAGLTFLAILQAKKGQKMLIPQIETPMEDSELFIDSIGRLTAERIKYKVPELSIVKIEGPQKRLKWLIKQMTCADPVKRFSAQEVLNNLEQWKPLDNVDNDYQQVKLVRTMKLPEIPVINAKDQLLVRVLEDQKYWIRVMDKLSGEVISEMTSMCNHVSYLKKHPTDDESLLEKCSECKIIRVYNTKTKTCDVVYSAAGIMRLNDAFLVWIMTIDSPN